MAERIDDTAPEWARGVDGQPTSVGPQPLLAILPTASMRLRNQAWDHEWEPSQMVEGPTYGLRVAARADPVLQPRRAATMPSTVTGRMVPRVAPINLSPQPLELHTFIDRVIVPALLDRFPSPRPSVLD